ncbi:hypothetical protein H696_03303 [Fonticula alba]|uniref:Disease resistance R13L4/SHOC-2-like LRR domain-containing protein n=1 Tax=Fonticula alba TaxID=691883 RepID=A0A058Z6D4_FONAL|nr:hypothetical protein H696_03303 [Fonticula alba]KCV69830.1 hypothetical protein H696_03303 [Fonticula alba]|eukprot:XP_009495436.1 hypothetical protein H696_03303 [Fonticula alba]
MGNAHSSAIKRAAITGELDLSYSDLKTLPTAIYRLDQLEKLVLAGNQITTIDNDIGKMLRLRVLHLDGNALKDLPRNLSSLAVCLMDLKVSFNQLTRIPSCIFSLNNIVELDLSSNQIQEIPEAIGALSSLKVLRVHGNLLTDLPSTLSDLPIRVLELNKNKFVTLPPVIGQMRYVETLDLSEGILESLDEVVLENLSRLVNLRELNVSSNKICIVPDMLADLFRLRLVDLSDNPVKRFDERARLLPNLRFNWNDWRGE